MKKRLLAGIAVVAIAATCAVGFTACGNNGTMTKEEWEKVWQDTAAADSYTYVENLKGVDIADHGGNSPYDYCREVRYDNVNKTIALYEHGVYIPEWYKDGYTHELYYEVAGNDILSYERYSADDEWDSYTSSISFWDEFNYLASIASEEYSLTMTESGYLKDMYDYAVYNSKTQTYTLNFYWASYEIQFKDGYLYKLVISGEISGEAFTRDITVTAINSTVVIVPQEVKDAVGGTTNPEQPDGGNDKTPDEEDTGVTKEEWIKAWQDSTSADSYALDYDGWTFMVSTDEVGNKYYVKMLYDNVNKTTYMQYADSNEESELYAEVVGSNLLQYINSNGEWLSSTWPASNWENGNQLLSYASTVYTVAETTVSGTLAELYDYVKYDASSKTYSVNATIKDNIVTLKVQLSDGYLYKLFISVEVDGETYEDEITFTGYNSTVVTVPQEVKDAVSDNGNGDNSDEVSYVGTYKTYSVIFNGTEYFVGDTMSYEGDSVTLTEDFIVIVLNEDGTATVSQTAGTDSYEIPCTWEAFDVFITIYMNGDPQDFHVEDNTIFATIYVDVNAVDPLVFTITLIKQ